MKEDSEIISKIKSIMLELNFEFLFNNETLSILSLSMIKNDSNSDLISLNSYD